MVPSHCPFSSLHLPCLLLMFLLLSTFTSLQSLCHDDESFALSQFKQGFLVKKFASDDPSAYPKVASWNSQGNNTDCCLWDGVECDEDTGHVIGLDLSSSSLYGSINSSSSLFHLVHLQRLNLGDNNFNFSQVPSKIGLLSKLTYLNLSNSVFFAQIPSEIIQLSNLTSLDLGRNGDPSLGKFLELKKFDMRRLAQNLTRLKILDLSYVNISFAVPNIFANLSSLTFLNLKQCNLWGLVPSSLGDLTNLGYLDLGYNNFSGQIPSSFGNLTKLNYLFLGFNNLSGQIPSWLANLTQLNILSLSYNNFIQGSLSWLGMQNKLTSLDLSGTHLDGEIPSSFRNLTCLLDLNLWGNKLTGKIPLWLSNLTQLTTINLGFNAFYGQVPESIANLLNLEKLDLRFNQLNGTVKIDMFIGLKHLKDLVLSGNNFWLFTKTSTNGTFPKFKQLGLVACNISEFPDFLRHQDELIYLYLGTNNIQGQIPKWIGNIGRETLVILGLRNNFLTGFEQSSVFSPMTNLQWLYLDSNKLEGPLPTPPLPILVYGVSNNSLTGEISSSFCNTSSLIYLDLSNNNLSGMIPQCLGNISDSLLVLNLANNFLSGSIPISLTDGSNLRMIDLSHNRLEGQLPRSLAKSRMLESLDLSENRIRDIFPSWLGALPKLEVLILRSNQFFGAIGGPTTAFMFSKLRIIDLSSNNFSGVLTSDFFQSLSSMKAFDLLQLAYMEANRTYQKSGYTITTSYLYQIRLVNKGIFMKYWKIPNVIAAIDLSCNRFQGDIPDSIGTLKMVNVLNLSHNFLSSQIPSLLGSLTKLESLDLSGNMLSGEIPLQLKQLTFLAFFDVSHNQLVGHIPQGKQFDTFDNSSYEGNSGLCGNPLSKKCNCSEASLPKNQTSEKYGDSNVSINIDRMIILIGYGSGLVVGVVLGLRITIRKSQCFQKIFGRRPEKARRRKEKRRTLN